MKNSIRFSRFCAVLFALLMPVVSGVRVFADPAAGEQNTIDVCVTMEKLTLGQGYIIEPTIVTVPEGTQASVVITDLLKQRYPDTNPCYQITGTETSGFYLAQVYDPDQRGISIPDYIVQKLGGVDQEAIEENAKDEWLGEFDYTGTSGWMYSTGMTDTFGDNKFPNVGAADYPLNYSGEVIRWQFTLYGYGADLGADNSEWGEESIVESTDKDALIWTVARLRSEKTEEELAEIDAYKKAMETLLDPCADQDTLEDDLTALVTLNSNDNSDSSGQNEQEQEMPKAAGILLICAAVAAAVIVILIIRKHRTSSKGPET